MVEKKKDKPESTEAISSETLDPTFKNDVATEPGGENIKVCFSCGTCTASCPIAEIDSRYDPRRIIHQVLLGMREEVLSDPVLWHCYLCYTCYARCPQNVKFTNIMEALRRMAVREGYMSSETEQAVTYLDEASRRARVKAVEKACGMTAEGTSLSETELTDLLRESTEQEKGE